MEYLLRLAHAVDSVVCRKSVVYLAEVPGIIISFKNFETLMKRLHDHYYYICWLPSVG